MVPLLAALLSISLGDRYAPLTLTPAHQRQRTIDAVLTLLRALALAQPVLLIVEDLHWSDPSTLELLELLVVQAETMRLYVLLTCRPEFQASWPHLVTLPLSRLETVQVEALVTHVTKGKILPPEVIAQIVTRTEGVPLFVEEVTQMVLASDVLHEHADRYELTRPLPTLAIPSTLQELTWARLEGVGSSAQMVAQVASTWGRGIMETQLQAVVSLDRRQLPRVMARLVEAEILQELSLPPRVTYVFKHALIQDAIYLSMPDTMRREVHQRIAQVLEEQFTESAESQPEVVAHHYTEAGQDEAAVDYWQRAGQRALQQSANQEAIAHLRQGLALLTTLPETSARLRQELDLQVALGSVLMATKGYAAPDVERTYARSQELCDQIEDTPQLIPVLRGLLLYYLSQGDIQRASQLGEPLLRLAQAQPDSTLLMLAYQQLGIVLFFRGEPAPAQTSHEGPRHL